MKNYRFQIPGVTTLIFLVLFGCASENDENPVDITSSLSEIITHTSEVSIGEYTFKKELTVRVTFSPEGEPLSTEVLSRTLDGVEMDRVADGKWSISITVGEEAGQRSSNTLNNGATAVESEDCDTVSSLIGVVPNPIPLGPSLCIYSTETTCYETGYDSNGVLTTIITVEDGVAFGICSPY